MNEIVLKQVCWGISQEYSLDLFNLIFILPNNLSRVLLGKQYTAQSACILSVFKLRARSIIDRLLSI